MLKKLLEKRAKAIADARAMLDAAGDGGLEADKREAYDALIADAEGLTAQIRDIERQEKLEREQAEAERRAAQPSRNVPPPGSGDGGGEPSSVVETQEYREAFVRGIARGDLSEARAMTAGTATAGNELVVPTAVATSVLESIAPLSALRRLARVFPMPMATALGLPKFSRSGIKASWKGENEDSAEKEGTTGDVTVTPARLTAHTEISDRLAALNVVDIEALVVTTLAESFANAEEEAMCIGDGTAAYGNSVGLFDVAHADKVAAGTDHVIATAGLTAADDLQLCWADHPVQLWRGASWVFSSSALPSLLTLKDANNNYHLQLDGTLKSAYAGMLAGRPVEFSDYCPWGGTTLSAYLGAIVSAQRSIALVEDPGMMTLKVTQDYQLAKAGKFAVVAARWLSAKPWDSATGTTRIKNPAA